MSERERLFLNTLKKKYNIRQMFTEFCPCPVMVDQQASEFKMLLETYISNKPRTVVEIGQYHGGTLFYWAAYAQPYTKIIAVDINHDPIKKYYAEHNIHFPNIEFITGDSTDPAIIQKVKEKFSIIDFIFIDGHHDTEIVKQDVENFRDVSNIISMHDIVAASKQQNVRGVWEDCLDPQTFDKEEFKEIDPKDNTDKTYGIGIASRKIKLR